LHLQWFLIFSFFHFTLPQTLENIFQTIFQNAIKHRKKIIFPEIIYICKYFTVENNLRRNKRSLSILQFLCQSLSSLSLSISISFYHPVALSSNKETKTSRVFAQLLDKQIQSKRRTTG
jgi:hypothetical protein